MGFLRLYDRALPILGKPTRRHVDRNIPKKVYLNFLLYIHTAY